MINFKRLAFITVMVVTLLAIGNLTTLAQANNQDIATPTPTGTPFSQGEPVSAEQQEELKAVIQAYFEVCYHARSISQPHGFRLNGFGDLVDFIGNSVMIGEC
jgi:hypothetical protein